jgi:2-polyprenyl-3-methyl-5-hydroxy-6-metoxy-1,4-benzoquinol methylase
MFPTDPYAQKAYWEQAGRAGYGNFMYSAAEVEQHVLQRMWAIAVAIGHELGLHAQAHVLDLGCGDGAFANRVLARHFRAVDGLDFAEAAIGRARAEAPRSDIRFDVADVTRLELGRARQFDGAFLIGILHHMKQSAPSIVRQLRELTTRVVVLEPNGDHVLRKLIEFTPSYRAAGEESFRSKEVIGLFERAGFRTVVHRRLNLFPNFTPRPIFRLLRGIEPLFESTPGLRAFCTVNMFGFAAPEVSSADADYQFSA